MSKKYRSLTHLVIFY